MVDEKMKNCSRPIRAGKTPLHIAIIMDGNGRWATKKGLPRIKGHIHGVQAVRKTIKAAKKLGIKYLTLYAFSTENWRRDEKEIHFLFSLLKEYLRKEKKSFEKNRIRFLTIGNIQKLPRDIQDEIKSLKKATSEFKDFFLILALNYGSRDEITRAVKKVLKKKKIEDVGKSFENSLDTAKIPDPDLIIRTSGEMRLSNFLLYQAAYSELYFTKTLWPDFDGKALSKAIYVYKRRKRRFGGY